jgi:hypothetical protein
MNNNANNPVENVSQMTISTFNQGIAKPPLEINLSSATLIVDSDNINVATGLKASFPEQEQKLVDDSSLDMSSITCLETSCDNLNVLNSRTEPISINDRLEKPRDSVILPINYDQDVTHSNSAVRHGISRYAPYGMRFAARMKDGQLKTSHIAGDLANRARQKNGRGCKVDLILVTHEGERHQLDSALSFYEAALSRKGPKPGPSEVLYHLKEINCDWDYRKGDGVKLLQRNASNFFKRMMEHARRINHPVVKTFAVPVLPTVPKVEKSFTKHAVEFEVSQAARILEQLMHAKIETPNNDTIYQLDNENFDQSSMDIDSSIDDSICAQKSYDSFDDSISDQQSTLELQCATSSNQKKRAVNFALPQHHKGSFYYELCKHLTKSRKEETLYYSKAAENFDWDAIKTQQKRKILPTETEDFDSISPMYDYPCKKPKLKLTSKTIVKQPIVRPQIQPNYQPVLTKGKEVLSHGVRIKGLSRHSPYGTRFCAQMPNGEIRESFLAGDLADRVRSPDGKTQSELILVLHLGEIQQLEVAWEFLKNNENSQIGAGSVLDYLRSLNLDENHRKQGSKLLQKNAGNFFKRVQEYGRRKLQDQGYLSV